MELAQILLVGVVSILTLLLVVVGIQAMFILRDFRKSIKRFNNILEDAQSVSSSIAKPLSSTGNVFESFRQMKNMVDYVAKRPEANKQKQKKIDDTQKVIQTIRQDEEVSSSQVFLTSKPQARVFKRNGRPLTS